MIQYHIIADDNDKIKISVGYDGEKNIFYMPSIEFTEIPNREYPDQTEIWDNDHFIFQDFKKFLKHWIKRTTLDMRPKKKYNEHFSILYRILDINEGLAKELLTMLKQAEKQGWYVRQEVLQTGDGNQ